MKRTIDVASQVKEQSKKEPVKSSEGSLLLVPTGTTTLNLACSDNSIGGFGAGKIVNLIGDSSSGKTLLALSLLAELSLLKEFDGYDLVYDDAEAALEFDLSYLFGEAVAERILPPGVDKEGVPMCSEVIQDFQSFVMARLEKKKPFIYILDSFDSLTSKQEQKKVKETLAAHRKGTETKGDYAMVNPKVMSQTLRMINKGIKITQSLILIISQTRDNIDPMSFETKRRSGGRALKFYSTHEVWLAMAGKHTKTVNGLQRVIGNKVKFKVSKNKITGKVREGEFDVFYDYGVDDIGSCVDFLVKEKHWTKTPNVDKIKAPELKFDGTRRALVRKIENEDQEGLVIELTQMVWTKVEESLKLKRKRRFK